jgi:hypothetical protein
MEVGTSGGKTHDHRKVRKHTDYHCSTSPGGIRVIVFIFSQGKKYGIDNWRNGREDRGSVEGLIAGVMIKICGVNGHARRS